MARDFPVGELHFKNKAVVEKLDTVKTFNT